jgi:hypothetical protein
MGKISIAVFGVVLFLMIALVGYASCPEEKQPQIGHTFKGTALYSGSVLASKAVTATIGDNEVSTTTDSNGNYQIVAVKCGTTGSDTIYFTVCTRSAGSETFSAASKTELNLTISSACPTTTTEEVTGGGGGGAAAGGAITPTTPVIPTTPSLDLDAQSDFSTEKGYAVEQGQGEKATFSVGGTKYAAEVTAVAADSITVTIGAKSEVLKVGGSAEFDVDGDGANDISVTLKSIKAGKAELIYKLLGKAAEEAKEEIPAEKKEEKKAEEVVEEEVKEKDLTWLWWVIAGIVIIAVIIYFSRGKKADIGTKDKK